MGNVSKLRCGVIVALPDGRESTITDQISKFLGACRKHGNDMWTVELELSQATTKAMRHVLKDGSQSER